MSAGGEGREDCVKNRVGVPARIARQKPQDQVSVLLEKNVFSAVPPPSLLVGQVLRPVEFEDKLGTSVKEIHLH